MVVFADGNFDALGLSRPTPFRSSSPNQLTPCTGTSFQLSDWLLHTPKDILAQNFGVNASLFDNLPSPDPWLLHSTVAPPQLGHAAEQAVVSAAGEVPSPYVWDLGLQNATEAAGGWVKIQDSVTNFHVSTQVASALVYVKPGALRELHWHRDDEYVFCVLCSER